MDNDMVEENLNIPKPCQYKNLGKNKNACKHIENIRWITENFDRYPLWSRLSPREQPNITLLGNEKNFTTHIPERLISLFGNSLIHTDYINKMGGMVNHYFLTNIYALCAAHSYEEWSEKLLNSIIISAIDNYPHLLNRHSISDDDFDIEYLNQSFNFKGIVYKVRISQVSVGTLYFRGIVTDFNLARNLNWFFERFQFGLLCCLKRCLAFGHVLNSDYGFFMYDCQTRGYPLFDDYDANAYILRTSHLQILLYCLIVTLNINADMTEFTMHRVDINIENPLERACLKKEEYIPTITSVDNEIVKNIKFTNNLEESGLLILKDANYQQQITMDPDKFYCVLALPKDSNETIAEILSNKLLHPKVKSFEYVQKPEIKRKPEHLKLNMRDVNTVPPSGDNNEVIPTTSVKTSESSITLTPEHVKGSVAENVLDFASKTLNMDKKDICDQNVLRSILNVAVDQAEETDCPKNTVQKINLQNH